MILAIGHAHRDVLMEGIIVEVIEIETRYKTPSTKLVK